MDKEPHPGVETPRTDKRQPSEAQLDANRRNARSSTGPRTEAGKARSSQNAITHGAFASASRPIAAGALAEDPNLVLERIDQLVEDLAPRNTIAARQAHEIAGLFLRLDRLERYETLALEGAGRFSSDERAHLGDEDGYFVDWTTSQDIELALEPQQGGSWNYAEMLLFLRRHAAADEALLELRGDWDGRTPQSPAEEELLFRAIIEHYWPDGELTDWMVRIRKRLLHGYAASHGRLAEVASRQSLAVLDRTIQLRSALGNQLLRALALFEMCQRGHFTMPRMGGA